MFFHPWSKFILVHDVHVSGKHMKCIIMKIRRFIYMNMYHVFFLRWSIIEHYNALANAKQTSDMIMSYILRFTDANQMSLRNVTLDWLTSEYMQLASGFMQPAAAGRRRNKRICPLSF